MANFIPIYVFISIIPIVFVLVAWYSIQRTREVVFPDSNSSTMRVRNLSATMRAGTMVELEMQDLNSRMYGEGADADDRDTSKWNDSLPDKASCRPSLRFATGEHEARMEIGSSSRSGAPYPAPNVSAGAGSAANRTSAVTEWPRSNPDVPSRQPWWEFTEDDVDGRIDRMPSFRKGTDRV